MIKKRKLKLITPWILIILILAVFFGPKIYGTLKSNIKLENRVAEFKKKIEDLETQNEQFRDFIANFKKEEYIEKEAKTRLSLKKPGEKVVIIIEEEIKKTEEEIKEKTSFFEKFWQKIKEGWGKRD